MALSSSPTFLKYRANLVRYLHDSYDLNGKSIVEIGCGAGHFLKALCETGKSFGIGYDPSLPEDVLSDERVRFIRDYYSEAHAPKEIDLICCRHVLEHMAQPLEFLSRLRSGLARQRNVTLYFEVPNAEFVFAGMGLWDIIYPHVSYFSLRSFQTLFMRAGFAVHPQQGAPTRVNFFRSRRGFRQPTRQRRRCGRLSTRVFFPAKLSPGVMKRWCGCGQVTSAARNWRERVSVLGSGNEGGDLPQRGTRSGRDWMRR